jgi:hypothetical protein
MPSPRSPLSRELYLHSDPAAVGDWCRRRATAGAVFIAPSAAARRLALGRLVDASDVAIGLTIASPGRLLPLLESRAGLPAPRTLSSALERILVGSAARDARVPLFDDASESPPAGAVRAVASLVHTLRRNRVTPQQLEEAGGDARAAGAYRRFEVQRSALGLADDTDRVDALLAAGVPALPLVIEDPAFPHRVAWELYAAAIGASPSCAIGVSDLVPDGDSSSPGDRLVSLGLELTRGDHTSYASPSMRAVGGVGMHDEVDLVAREMLALLRSRPDLRPSDLLGVAPNATYLALLADACARVGIPVASPRRVGAADVPLVSALLETFRLLADAEQDTPERGLALLATPYVGLTLDRHDRLARTLVMRGLGALRTWHRFAEGTRSRKFVALASNVAKLALRIEGQRAPKELASALGSLALDFGFVSSGRRSNLAAGRDEALRLDQAGWTTLTDAADELDDALRVTGTTRIAAREWLALLSQTIAESTVRADAKPSDGVHLTIAGAGLPAARHVFAVGWREGLFPRRTREDPLLPERVKRALNEMGAMIPLAADRSAREQERRERIRRAARESLVVSWPATSEDGEQQLPSFYLDDLGIRERAARSVGDPTWRLALAASRGERIVRATMVARHRSAESSAPELDAVRDALSSLSGGERRAYDGLLHAEQVIHLPAEILAEAAPLAGRMSASQAKLIAHCLYEHFGKKRLGLGALAAPPLDQLLLGTIGHGVLREVGRLGFEPGALDEVLERWWHTKVPLELRDDAQTHFERDLLHMMLRDLVEQEHRHYAASPGRPAYFELGFGTDEEGRDPASRDEGLDVPLPPGSPISFSTLRGSIDRVDVVERGGRLYGVAIDYKSGKGAYQLTDMNELADFQLPIYCEVLPLFGIEPVGAVYLGIRGAERYGVMRSDFADVFVPRGSGGKIDKLGPDEFSDYMRYRQRALRAEIARVARGELVTRPRNDECGFCDLRPVCRIGTFGVGVLPEEL